MIARHWRGETPILTAMLGVGVLGTVLIVSAGRLLLIALRQLDLSLAVVSALDLAWFAGCCALWIWIAVGIWRSADGLTRSKKLGVRSILGVASLALLPLAYSSAISASELTKLLRGNDPLGVPARVHVEGSRLWIEGALAEGSANAVQEALTNSAVSTVVITSPGGRILEAQQIASLVRKSSLNTEAKGLCASACTLVLLSGKRRRIWPNSQIGFHQSTFAGNNWADDDLETEQVRSTFRSAGVAENFIQKAFSTRRVSMWYPSEDDMISAGYLTDSSLPQLLDQVAGSLSSKLPRRVDEVTVLRAVQARELTLTYKYTLERPVNGISRQAFESELGKEIRRKGCSDRDIAALITRGATLRSEYYDPRGNLVGSIPLSRCSASS